MSEEEYAERLGRVQKFVNKQNSRIKEDLIAGPTAIPVILRVSPKNDLKGEARTFSSWRRTYRATRLFRRKNI